MSSHKAIAVVAAGLVGVAVSLIAVVGMLPATGSSRGAGSEPPASRVRAVQERFDVSDVKAYSSLQNLRQDATSVVVFRPSSVTRVETITGVPFTVTTVSVVQTISGTPLPSVIELRQLGNGTDPSFPLVSDSNLYLAYLQPFEFQPGVPVGQQYVVIGGLQGIFEQIGAQSAVPSGSAAPSTSTKLAPLTTPAPSTSFARVDPDAVALPSTITVQQAQTS